MSAEIAIVFVLLAVATILFVIEKVSFDVTALLVMSVLMLTGILTPREGLSGFSHAATVTIAAMFVLSEGMRRTGVLKIIANALSRLGERNFTVCLVVSMAGIALVSAFINNTAAVTMFIPVMIGLSAKLEKSASKLLMPLSFAAMMGGVCTVLGTSTNILVSSIADKEGIGAFSMFEFLPVGLLFVVAGFAYMFTIGVRLIPERRGSNDLTSQFGMNEYLTDVELQEGFDQLGEPLDSDKLLEDLDLAVIHVFQPAEDSQESELDSRQRGQLLQVGDVLRIRGSVSEINKLVEREDLALKPARTWADADLELEQYVLVEAVIAPDSPLEQKRVRDINTADRFGAALLGLRHHGELTRDRLDKVRLSGGDSLLLMIEPDQIPNIQRDSSFVLVSEVGLPDYRPQRLPLALAIMAGVVLCAATGLIPITIGAVSGAVLMLLTGCLTTEEAYQAISWKVIFLLAGVLPLGIAMEKTGAAQLLADGCLSPLQAWGPHAVLAGLFLLSMLLTNLISNQATVALLAPIVLQMADTMGVSARPLLMAITYAASLSFMTPVGYQTNTLIYGPGQYRFTDFTKVGTPLNLIFWIIGSLAIPLFWPF